MAKTDTLSASEVPWQLRMFRKTPKKRQKIALLRGLLECRESDRCLLVTDEDNNGVMNHVLRDSGRTLASIVSS